MPYIAKSPLFVGNARAHNPGDVVPDDNVERNGWQDDVEKVSDTPDAAPSKSASKADWEAFARTRGATDADIEGWTKEDLVTQYGSV